MIIADCRTGSFKDRGQRSEGSGHNK